MFQSAVNQHVNANKHHPEYWGSINVMPDIYIAEMVCDWLARSQEFGTDVKAWINNVAMYKFGISKVTLNKIDYFLTLLIEAYFTYHEPWRNNE